MNRYGPLFIAIKVVFKFFSNIYPFKWLTEKVCFNANDNAARRNEIRRVVHDFYMLFEMFLVVVLHCSSLCNIFIQSLVWFLLLTKLVYNIRFLVIENRRNQGATDFQVRSVRRFYVAVMSFTITILYFSVLYRCNNVDVSKFAFLSQFLSFLLFSLANTLGFFPQEFKEGTGWVPYIQVMQIAVSSVYIVMLISNTIPNDDDVE